MKITKDEIVQLYIMFDILKDKKYKGEINNYSEEIDIERDKNDKLVSNYKYSPLYKTEMVEIGFKGDFTKI
jgi:hypothetical protein